MRVRRSAVSGRVVLAVLVFAGLASTVDAEAATSKVWCGQRITRDTTLTADLHCKKNGRIFATHGIRLDLGGYDIIGPGRPGTIGIENPGYHDVDIVGYKGGTVRGFDRGIEIRRTARFNFIAGMHVSGGHYGLVMDRSGESRLDDNVITAGAAKDGYDGGFGAAIHLYRSHDNLFERNVSQGNNVSAIVLDESQRNDISGFNFNQEIWDDPAGHMHDFAPNLGTGLMLRNSDENRIVGNIFAENVKDGIFLDSRSTGNLVEGNLAINNNKLGINVRGTNKDGGGNRALGNGWSAQCRGIPCAHE
jgi:parallel beta-helix repeat protein